MNEIAISPDGSRIVYIVEEGGKTAVYSRQLGDPQAQRLDIGRDVRGPTLSPDGTWLAFFENFDTLMRVSLSGGPPQRIATVPRPSGTVAWLADGKLLYAEMDVKRVVEVDVAKGSRRVVAQLQRAFEGFENVAASPDPDWVLADGWNGMAVSDYRVMAVHRTSGALEVLVENASNPAVVGDDILIFQRGAALFAMRFDFHARRALGEARLVFPGVSTDRWGGSSQFAVSPEGTLVVVPGKRRGEGRRIVWTSPDGTIEPISSEPDAFSQNLDLSRAGNALVVGTLRNREELWSLDLVGRSMSPVVVGESMGCSLSPRGDTVFYGINTEDGGELRSMRLGSGATTILAKGRYHPTSVSAEGRHVLLWGNLDPAQSDNWDILSLDTALEPPQLVPWIATPARESNASLSPDDKWLAYQSDRAGRTEIFVRAWPDGQRDWKVSAGPGEEPRWSPDGQTLYYLDGARLMAVDLVLTDEQSVSVGAAREVLANMAFAEFQKYGVGRDGRIAMVQLADWELAESRLQVVVGWAAELERVLAPTR
ncbi:MAG: PD40 domain-containing protein [Planctomycetes bacterium]|nr:PD40 domain-containing protein [Planctomycetota bacterium]